MKRTSLSIMLLSVICLCLYGCGGDTRGVYTTDVSFLDADNDDVLGFDVFMDICTAATATEPAEMETYTDVIANITLSVGDGMPGITVNSYSVNYIPLTSVDSGSNPVTPPSLEPLTDNAASGSYNTHIETNSTESFPIECFTVSQKAEYRNLMGAATYTSRYTVRIVLHCTDDSGYDRDIEIRRTILLANYDNC